MRDFTTHGSRESFEATFYQQREDLKELERNLRQREDMLCKGRQHLSEREEKDNEREKNSMQKKRDLELLEKKIDSSNLLLKEKEAEIRRRVEDLETKEKVCFFLQYLFSFKCKHLFSYL